jgi:flagellin
MSRINTNVPSLVAQNQLARSQGDLQVRLQRLSTGLAINRGADNPAGLIVSERLRSEIEGVGQAIENAERASNVIATTEAALNEVNTLLISIKSLIIEAANDGGFSKEEHEANQLQIDAAIESVNRIANTTSFAGLKLLNGSLDYQLSGVNGANIRNVEVTNANFGTRTNIPVTVEVINSAQTGALFLSGNAAGVYDAVGSTGSALVTIAGPKGVATVQFISGMTNAQVVDSINDYSQVTGVSAALVNGNPVSGIVLQSQEYGSNAFVEFKSTDEDFMQTFRDKGDPTTTAQRDRGVDVLALVNGNVALGDGLNVSLRSGSVNLALTLDADYAQTLNVTETFHITGGGTKFQIGPAVNLQQQVNIGIPSVHSSSLGNNLVGRLDSLRLGGANSLMVDGREANAQQILDVAIDQVTKLRGRLGAFERNTLDASIRSSSVALENLTASQSRIRDADFAKETAALTRAQILVNAGTNALALANSSSQSVLSLLQ